MHENRPLQWLNRLRNEPRTLLVLGAAAGLLLAFIDLSEEVLTGETHAFDRTVLLALRINGDLSRPIGPHWMVGMFRDITALGSPTVITLMTAMAFLYLIVAGKRTTAFLVFLSIALGAATEKAMKLAFDRTRPDVVPHLVDVHSLSFPSGHAMLSAITYLTLAVLLAKAQNKPRIRAFVLSAGVFITLTIGISRVYLGVHWPTDVLGGWTAGSIWVMGVWLVSQRFEAPGSGTVQQGKEMREE